ncbi:transposase [bacterium CPR1]|nr:transposase [bacterium CPR1]
MFQLSPQTKILVAVEPVDGRKGIDGLAALCRQRLAEDPFSGCVFIFRTRSGSSIRLLAYDGQGFWLAQKRLSQGRFLLWPQGQGQSCTLEPHQAHVLLAAGNPAVTGAPLWRSVRAGSPAKQLDRPGGTSRTGQRPSAPRVR